MPKELIEEYADIYEGSVNPGYFTQLLLDFCKIKGDNRGLCISTGESKVGRSLTRSAKDKRSRRKRFALPAAVLTWGSRLGTFAKVAGGVATGVNSYFIFKLNGEINTVVNQVDRLAHSVGILEDTVTKLHERGIRLSKMYAEGFIEVYQVVEQMRCSDFQDLA